MKVAVSLSAKEYDRGQGSPYIQALLQAGAAPDALQVVRPGDSPEINFDRLLLTGGADVDPTLYGEQPEFANVIVDRRRDDLELGLVERALRQHRPVLAVCRGLQLVNVALGGSLYQDLPRQLATDHRQKLPRTQRLHQVVASAGSRQTLPTPLPVWVNSLHHQAVKRTGNNLLVAAVSAHDELVEAMWGEPGSTAAPILAVQWHPEELRNDPTQLALFEWLLAES